MQTSWIAASLLVAFFVFVTVRGELPDYIAVFTGTDADIPGRVYDSSGRPLPAGATAERVYDASGKEIN